MFCKEIEVLDTRSVANELFPEFGEDQVKLLCNKFGLSFSAVKNDYREFKKESKGIRTPIELKKQKNLIDTIPVSTAACERGFSKTLY